jgi:hypothetical protein
MPEGMDVRNGSEFNEQETMTFKKRIRKQRSSISVITENDNLCKWMWKKMENRR